MLAKESDRADIKVVDFGPFVTKCHHLLPGICHSPSRIVKKPVSTRLSLPLISCLSFFTADRRTLR